jgi:hypothetical protein
MTRDQKNIKEHIDLVPYLSIFLDMVGRYVDTFYWCGRVNDHVWLCT